MAKWCLGPELTLDPSNCIQSADVNTASGPMAYDAHGNPVQLPSSAWPYPCPIASANGLMTDPNLGMWNGQPSLLTWTAHVPSPPGTTYPMPNNGWVFNDYNDTLTMANPTCLPLQVVVSVTLRAVIVLTDTHYAQMVAWLGQGIMPDKQYLPQYATAHLHDPTVPGAVPFTLDATITRRVAMPPSGVVHLTSYMGVYQNFSGNSTSAAPYQPSGVHSLASTQILITGGSPPAAGSGSTGQYVSQWSRELFAQGWPSLYPVADA